LISKENQDANPISKKKSSRRRRLSNASQKSKSSQPSGIGKAESGGNVAEKMIPEKSEQQAMKTINLGKEFGNKFVELLQKLEDGQQNQVSKWLYRMLEAVFVHF